MTISRSQIASYLDEQFSSLAAAIDQDEDTETGYSPDINNALRLLGTAESDLATATVGDGLRSAVFAIAEYYAALRFWRQLGDRVDNTMGETTYKFDGQRKQAKEMMEDAARRLVVLGYIVDGSIKTALFQVY